MSVGLTIVGCADEQGCDLGVDIEDAIGLRLDMDHARLVVLHLRAVVGRVGDDDDRVAAVDEPGRGAVDLHVARAALAGDGVGLEAGAVVDVDDGHLLVLEDVGGLEEVGVYGDRADVMQIAAGHRRPVDLGLEHRSLHQGLPVEVPLWLAPSMASSSLSMRRTAPTRAATATSTGSPSMCWTGTKVSGVTIARYSGSTPRSCMAARAA